MRLATKLIATLLVAHVAPEAMAWAQTTPAAATVASDPLAALWSLIGSSSVAGVLYIWVRSEKQDRQTEQTERRAAQLAKDQIMAKMVDLLEADVDHKAELRARLKGQDDLLSRMQDTLQRLERKAGG